MRRLAPALALAAALGGCGGGAPAPVAARPATDPGFVSSGAHELRYGTVPTAALPREVLVTYGIQPRAGVMLLGVSVLRGGGDGPPVAVGAALSGSLRTLAGEPRPLAFREIVAGGSVSWITELAPSAPGIVTIAIEALPADGGPRLAATFTRDFPPR